MKTSKIALCLLFCLLCTPSLSRAQDLYKPAPFPQINTTEDKVYALSLLWSEVKYNFVHIDKVSFDVDSLYRTTLSRVLQTTDDLAFYRELSRFMASFHDGHTELMGINNMRPYREDDYLNNWPAFLKTIGKKMYCYSVRSDCKELLGAEIVAIDGIPLETYVEKYVLPFCPGSTELSRWNYAANLTGRGYIGRRMDLTYRTPKGAEKTMRIGYDHLTGVYKWPNWVEIDEEKFYPCINYPVGLRWKGDIAVVNVDTFNDLEVENLIDEIDHVMQKIQGKAKGLILDLRNNGGGSTDVALHLQMYIDPSDSLLSFGSQTRINNGYGRAQGNYCEEFEKFYKYEAYESYPAERVARDKSIAAFSIPVVVLIGNGTASACEDFLVNIYELPNRPKIVGEPSNGSTGAPLVIELPHGAVARICTLRETFPLSGKPFVGAIQPDIFVANGIDDFMTGKDRVLEEGLNALKKQL